jgi:hypothetical protein
MCRVIKGMSLLDVHEIMKWIKNKYIKRVQYIIETDIELANDCDIDNTGIGEILVFSYTLKTCKLVIVILLTSYFTGVMFLVLCEGVDDFVYDADFGHELIVEGHEPGFLAYYGLASNTTGRNLLISLYFGFTTLSTVGFGDFAPRGNIERFVGSFILLFGVAIFSYIMGNFIDILAQIQLYNSVLEDAEALTKFFGIIEKFNNEKPIN